MRQRHPRVRHLPGRGGHTDSGPASGAAIARGAGQDALGKTILWVAEQPAHVCINEITISPTWNRMYIGGADLKAQ
jgi:hypothetical protein